MPPCPAGGRSCVPPDLGLARGSHGHQGGGCRAELSRAHIPYSKLFAMPLRLSCLPMVLFAVATLCGHADAQDYPSRPIRWVVPFPAGGPTDTLSRILAARLGDVWKAGIVIENNGGAAGAIGTDFAAKAAPDGYTIQLGTQSTNASNKIFYPNLPYDPIKDFEPLR